MKTNTIALGTIGLVLCIGLVGCGGTKTRKDSTAQTVTVSGGRSGIVASDTIANNTSATVKARRSALLGIFVSEYLSISNTTNAANSAILGVEAQSDITTSQTTVTDPDYQLLQAFADALQVDVADLLNRSDNRQESLDAYTTALNNVAEKANNRYKEVGAALEETKALSRERKQELSKAENELRTALRDKNFDAAGEKQKLVTEKQAAFSEVDLKQEQLQDLQNTLDQLLTLYGEKILAIEKNREALIAGTRVIDVPGAEELQVIQRERVRRSGGRGFNEFDSLFDEGLLPQ
jgi:hypothetical protein